MTTKMKKSERHSLIKRQTTKTKEIGLRGQTSSQSERGERELAQVRKGWPVHVSDNGEAVTEQVEESEDDCGRRQAVAIERAFPMNLAVK